MMAPALQVEKKFPLWRKGQPNNWGKKEDCVHIWKDDKLNDHKCQAKYPYVCQKDPSNTTTKPAPLPTKPATTTRAPTTTAAGPVIMLTRRNGKIDFDRTWAAYKEGFGNCQTGDCWIGLSTLHKLCMKNCKLEVTFTYKGKNYNSDYKTFSIGPKSDNYRLKIGGQSGNVADNLAINNGMQFSTKERDNDKWGKNCAKTFTGGWWYKRCHWAHPTGTWGTKAMGKGLVWKTLTTQGNSVTTITMKVTPDK